MRGDEHLHRPANGDETEARRGGRRWVHRPGDGGKPRPPRTGGDPDRAAQPGHAAARPGNGAARRALPGQARRQTRTQRRRGGIRARRRWLAGSPHRFGEEAPGGHRHSGHWREAGDGAREDGRPRTRPARRHPRGRSDAHEQPGHFRGGRCGRSQRLRHRPMDAHSAGGPGEPPGPHRGRRDLPAATPATGARRALRSARSSRA